MQRPRHLMGSLRIIFLLSLRSSGRDLDEQKQRPGIWLGFLTYHERPGFVMAKVFGLAHREHKPNRHVLPKVSTTGTD
ncbi:hypothetical protein ACP70R_010329 [Stipagrostis hirtigluma subsp. patula]